MRAGLAIVLAITSAVIAVILVRVYRPNGVRPGVTLVVTGLAAGVAEGASVVWIGAPFTPWVPVASGLMLGALVGWISSRRPPPKEPPAPPPSQGPQSRS